MRPIKLKDAVKFVLCACYMRIEKWGSADVDIVQILHPFAFFRIEKGQKYYYSSAVWTCCRACTQWTEVNEFELFPFVF